MINSDLSVYDGEESRLRKGFNVQFTASNINSWTSPYVEFQELQTPLEGQKLIVSADLSNDFDEKL